MHVPDLTGYHCVNDKVDTELEHTEQVEDGDHGGVLRDVAVLEHEGDGGVDGEWNTGDGVDHGHDQHQVDILGVPVLLLRPGQIIISDVPESAGAGADAPVYDAIGGQHDEEGQPGENHLHHQVDTPVRQTTLSNTGNIFKSTEHIMNF